MLLDGVDGSCIGSHKSFVTHKCAPPAGASA